MAAKSPALGFLASEWINRGHPSMAALHAALLALKGEKSYQAVMNDLALQKLRRHAHDVEYVTHLLYLVDERRLPIVSLQPIVGIQQGHLYRTFIRAGVEFVAAQSSVVNVDDGLYPWPGQVYVDPLRERVKVNGQDFSFTDVHCPVVVSLDEETRTFTVSHREGGHRLPTPPPLPIRRR